MGKGDRRHYLNGFFINRDKCEVVSTDGHRIVVSECLESHTDLPEQAIISFSDKAVPARAKSAAIYDDMVVYYSEWDAEGDRLKISPCEIVDADYPNYRALIDRREKSAPEPVEAIALNPDYLKSMLNGIDKNMALKLEFKGQDSAVKIAFNLESKTEGLIMPMRL